MSDQLAPTLTMGIRMRKTGRHAVTASVMGAITLLLTACVSSPRSPFSESYYDLTEGVAISNNPIVEPLQGQPGLYRGTDLEQDAQGMVENGYALIGYSSFNAGSVDDKGALFQARKVHASVILVYGQYDDDVSEINPFTAHDDRVSMTGEYGSVGHDHDRHSGNTDSAARGAGAIYDPYSGRQVNYFASYWVKLKPPIFGTSLEHLGAGEKGKSGIDRGMLVKAVVNDSPAFRAGVRKGDILLRIGVVEISGDKAFDDALKIYEGEAVDVVIYRNGAELEKRIRMPFAQ